MTSFEKALYHARTVYQFPALDEKTVAADPIGTLKTWLHDALAADLIEPNAMVLATFDGKMPRSRVVLLREQIETQLIFYTNFESAKAREIAAFPHASALFFWPAFMRQIRIEGEIKKIPQAQAQKYFATRPREHQLNAWASQQSAPLPDRETLLAAMQSYREKFADGEIPCPPYWGGYALDIFAIEFWQGQSSRLHDRICVTRQGSVWSSCRLAP